MIKRTWIATLVFALGFVGLELFNGWQGLLLHRPGLLSVVALAVTPPLWWWLVSRRTPADVARGALAGVLCAIAIVVVPTVVLVATSLMNPDRSDDRIVSLVRYAVVVIVWTGVVPLGAALGALSVVLQKSRLEPPLQPGS